MDREVETSYKDIAQTKLVITPDRVVIRHPQTLDGERAEKATKILTRIADAVGVPDKSLRGRNDFLTQRENYLFCLQTNSKVSTHVFRISGDLEEMELLKRRGR
jgi:hypothetical protein